LVESRAISKNHHTFDGKILPMKATSLLSLLSLMILIAFTSCKEEKKATPEAPDTEIQAEKPENELKAETRYQCPMDCEHGKTYDAPGTCPVCKMDLKPVAKEAL
jgi:hypothetical protein